MIVVSNDFKTAMKQPVKELQAFLDADSVVIRDDDDLISFKVSCESGLCKSAMRKLEAQYLGEHNLLGKWVSAGFGVKLPSGAYEYLHYGYFLVSELTFTKDTGVTSIVAYDKMVNTMKGYEPLNVEYPIDLYTYTQKLCDACGLELGTENVGATYYRVNMTDNTVYYKISAYNAQYNVYYDILTKDTSVKNNLVPVEGATGKNNGYQVYQYTDENGETKWCHAETQALTYTETTETIAKVDNGGLVEGTVTDNGNAVYTYSVDGVKHYYVVYGNSDSTSNWGLTIDADLWLNIDGITYRDIFVQIAQATASTCIIGSDDKVYFKRLTDTGEKLTYDNMFKLKLEPMYGEINSVVLSRTPQEDNVYLRDEESVSTNELTEFRIENNEIVDKDRESAIVPIYNALRGVSYYPFETTTEGLGWYEVGDCFTIENDVGDVFPTALFNYSITINGSVKETLKATADTKTQTQYQYATSIAKRVKNTEIIVNKQEQYIKSVVSDMQGELDGKYTEIVQDVEKIVQSVQNSGGGNLLKNSVMFATDKDGKPNDWNVGNGGLTMQDDADAINNGGVSGRSFTLTDNEVSQTVNVKVSTDADPDPACYTFSCRIKKGAVGECKVVIYNDVERYEIPLLNGDSSYYGEYELSGLYPKQNHYTVSIVASGAKGVTFTDCMFASGDRKIKWTQANGEVMNTQVCVSIDGVVVRRGDGDYTAMTPLEFAGYAKINGTMVRVFSLNKDTTEVRKLEAIDEMKMGTIKVVPVTSGALQGWAFVPTT